MLKAKAGLTGKPSKASLKSRGLHSNTHLRSWNEGTKTTSLDDGCYSLYSTDSEDVAGVNKGLDKCAELLTNILEIKGEKDAQKQYCQAILKNSKKEKYDSHSKCTKKEKGGQRQKRKSRIHIHVPRKSSQNNMQSSKSKPAFNKRVVSSTPEPTVVQRQRQQELQYKESMLQQQIQILQEQYENLQKEENSQDRQNSNPQIHSEIPPQLLITNNEQVRDENSRDQRPRSARKSLEFPSNAEKPLIENLKEHAGSTITTSSPLNQNDGKLGEEMQKSTMKKVQFVNGQERNEKLSEISQSLDNHEPSSPCSSKSRHGHSTGLSTAGVGIQHGVKKQINQCKKDDLKQPSPHKNTDHLRILTYLVGQLKAVLGTTDVEVQRLLMEIENEIRLLSYTAQYSPTHPVLANAGKQHDIDTEIALQPLRSENSDLRRKLRIANQRMREMESQCRKIPEQDQTRAPNEELVERLHHQLLKERESVEKFRHEVGLAEKRFQEYNKDKLNIQHILSDKEKDVNKLQEELKQQQGKAMTADTQAKLQFESIEITLNAKSKEVGLLNIALKQRDAEIERLTELTRGLQQSLTRVLSNVQELHPDDVISDVSIVSSVLDFHQPVGQRKIGPRVGIAMASSQFQPWDDDFYDQRKETHREEHNKMREYDIIKEEENGNSSLTDDSTDDVSLSPSSADEFVFKQELSNLDTVIARLQDSLRHKV